MGTACVSCKESPCETCDGSSECKTCPTGMESVFKQCDICTDESKIPLNKTCTPCTDLNAEGNDGMDCKCSDPSTCCDKDGAYKWASGEVTYCSACSYYTMGCGKCGSKNNEAISKCTKCLEGYTEKTDKDGVVCFSYSGYLFQAAGILVSLAILV